jgi:hypothetical protein
LLVVSVTFATAAWLAVPAAAGQHAQSSRSAPEGRSSSQHAGQRPAPQSSAPQHHAQAPQQPQQPAPQRSAQASYGAPQRSSAPVPQAAPVSPRAERPRTPPPSASVGQRGSAGPRSSYGPPQQIGPNRVVQSRSYVAENVVPYRAIRRPVFVRPYYAFRPRFSLGFGIYVGYPVAFPYGYYDPYAAYGYGYTVAPTYGTTYGSTYTRGDASYEQVGGLSFDIDPADAAVFIDGKYIGSADEFSSLQPPMTLAAGRHHVDLRAEGFLTVSFDITVVAGQVIPYQGTLPIR